MTLPACIGGEYPFPRSSQGGILALIEDTEMRFQDPEIEKCGKTRLYYQIRPYVPVVTSEGKVERRRKAIRLGWCDEMKASEAKARKQEVMALINGGPIVLQSQIPLKELIKRFRESRLLSLASTTQAKYTAHIDKHILPDLGHLRLAEIDKATLEVWFEQKREKLGIWARRDLRNIISTLFNAALDWKLWTGDNPAHGARVGKGAPKRKFHKPTDAQVLKFLDSIPDTDLLSPLKARAMAELSIVSGFRVSECLGLQPRDFDWTKQTATVQRRYCRGNVDEPKTAASSRTRFIGDLADTIRLFCKTLPEDGFIFTRPNGALPDDRDLQQHIWRPAAKAAGIYHEGFGLHSFRRLSNTWRQELGATPVEVAKQMGHTSVDMTLLYTMDDRRREAQVVEKIQQKLAAKAVGEA